MKRHLITALLWGSLLALIAAAALVLSGRVGAQARSDMSRAEHRLVAVLARVAFNEGLDSYPDLALIHQITEARGDTPARRALWLASHSRCAAGELAPPSRRMSDSEAYARPGLCRWTRNLTPDGSQPRGWIPSRDGHWSRMRPRWLAHLNRVRAFVAGEDTHRPCETAPATWDGRRPSWQEAAARRGWVPVACEGEARNVGYVRDADAS